MKAEMLLSTSMLAILAVLTIGALEAGSFPIKIGLTGLAMALIFYHVSRRNIGFSIDAALAKQSLLFGVVTTVPVISFLQAS